MQALLNQDAQEVYDTHCDENMDETRSTEESAGDRDIEIPAYNKNRTFEEVRLLGK
jgi:hypothetical protein